MKCKAITTNTQQWRENVRKNVGRILKEWKTQISTVDTSKNNTFDNL